MPVCIPADEDRPIVDVMEVMKRLKVKARLAGTKPVTGLEAMQAVVGGYVEFVRHPGVVTFMVNEEGKMMGLPINRRATLMWWDLVPEVRELDVLVGDVVMFMPKEAQKNVAKAYFGGR